MAPYCITNIRPPDFVFAESWREAIEALHFGLAEIGITAPILENRIQPTSSWMPAWNLLTMKKRNCLAQAGFQTVVAAHRRMRRRILRQVPNIIDTPTPTVGDQP
jgi:hypothetical protein